MAFEVSSQVTTSPVTIEAGLYAAVFPPTTVPLIFHTYTGVVPPLVMLEMNVTTSPEHTLSEGNAVMLIAGVTVGVTEMLTVLDVAIVGETQFAFDVIMQLTTSPLLSEVLLYCAVAPLTLLPFTIH